MSRNLAIGAGVLLLAIAGGVVMVAGEGEGDSAPYVVPESVAEIPPPVQPFPYSHKIHAGDLGLDCQSCHTGGEGPGNANASGAMMTFPGTDTCMGCHGDIATGNASIIQLTDYHNRSQPIPWRRVYTIAEGVTWSHQTHLSAGVECETCHGDVRALEVMAQTTAVAAMSSCISCHQARGAKTTCQTCHAWPTEQQLLRMND